MERGSVSFVSEYELKGKMLTGVCVSVCDTGFWSDTVVLCFGPNYPCVCFTLYNFVQNHRRERESQTWRISFP